MKLIMKGVLTAAVLLFFSGCTNNASSTAEVKLPKREAEFTWWADRSQPFGEYEYTLTDEAEALNDLKDKFQLELIPAFDEGRALIKSGLSTAEVIQEPEEYSIKAYKSELAFSSLIKFKNQEGSYSSYGTVSENYRYLKELEKVKLYSQRIELYNNTGTKKYNGQSLDETLRALGGLLGLGNMEQRLKEFKEATKNPEELKGKDIVIYEDYKKKKKEQLFGRSFGVAYNEEGTLERIYAITMDYRK